MQKRTEVLAQFKAGKATRDDVSKLGSFMRLTAFTPELFQYAEKIQKLQSEGKKEEADAALKLWDEKAQAAVRQREEFTNLMRNEMEKKMKQQEKEAKPKAKASSPPPANTPPMDKV